MENRVKIGFKVDARSMTYVSRTSGLKLAAPDPKIGASFCGCQLDIRKCSIWSLTRIEVKVKGDARSTDSNRDDVFEVALDVLGGHLTTGRTRGCFPEDLTSVANEGRAVKVELAGGTSIGSKA